MNPDGYVLSALELRMNRSSSSSATMSNLTVTLRNASGNNPDSTVLATFVNPDSPALSTTAQTFRFTLPENEELDPDTRYFIHLNNNHSSDMIQIPFTVSDNQDSGGLDDWGVDDDVREFTFGGWGNIGLMGDTLVTGIRLYGYAKPPPVPTGRILISNTGQTQGSPASFGSLDIAQGFRTGMTPEGYILSSLELPLSHGGLGPISNLTVTLRNASGTDPGSMVLATFVNPDSPALSTAVRTLRFNLSEGVELNPDTQYFIHVNYNHPSASIFSGRTLSDSQDSGGLEDWELMTLENSSIIPAGKIYHSPLPSKFGSAACRRIPTMHWSI